MKSIKILGLLAAFFAFQSCSKDFLDTEPLTEKTESNFYKTKADAWTALVGCYDGLQQVYSVGTAFPVASTVLSDDAFGGTGAGDGFGYQMLDEFDESRSPSDRNMFALNWSAYYSAIYRCNRFLSKMDEIDWEGDEELRSQYEAETKFLRAYCYFDMVRLWGNIPLLEEATDENVPQADPSAVYALIATDLTFAATTLSDEAWSSSWAAQNDGRASRWAAKSLLGRVFLYYTGYYQAPSLPTQSGSISSDEALQHLEDVIANSGHGLLENYASLWPAAAASDSVADYAGEGNMEFVYSIKYTFTSDYDGNTDGNHWMVMLGMRNITFFPYGQGWGAATVHPEFYNMFSEGDARQRASIISVEEEEIPVDPANQREFTGYYTKKYSPLSTEDGANLPESMGAVNFQIGQFQDFVSIRFADVLLMAAELGNNSSYFNMVRERAYGDDYTPLDMTQENLREERRLELAFEAIRYWDLLRYGLDYAADALNEPGIEVLNGGTPTTKTITFDQSTLGLQQIPYNEINLADGVLIQNPGW